uniref:Uncharacterized protein n=1 Tax=Arundo donax TaxID=35708 RepID=A0A0A9GHC7_ARUDO
MAAKARHRLEAAPAQAAAADPKEWRRRRSRVRCRWSGTRRWLSSWSPSGSCSPPLSSFMKQLHPGGAVVWQRRSQRQLLPLYFWALGRCSCSLQVVFMSDDCGYASHICLCSLDVVGYDRFCKHAWS